MSLLSTLKSILKLGNGCTIGQGSTGPKVLQAETKLRQLGYYSGKLDSSYGPMMTVSVSKFQKDHGMKQYGCIGPKTWNLLFPIPTPTPKPIPTPQKGVYQSPRFVHNLKQGTRYWCAPFMEEQLIYELYDIKVAQSELARDSGTGTSGTGHAGVISGITTEVQHLGHKVSCAFRNFSDVGWTKLGEMVEDPNIGIGIHCLYRNKWGHYMVPVFIDVNKKIVGFSDSLNSEDILYVPFTLVSI